MKKNFKVFLSGCITTVLALGLIGTAAATVGYRDASLYYNDIKVTVNGTQAELVDASGNPVEPFIISGTTYLPIRAISSALGLDVEWNGSTSTVVLTNPNLIETGTLLYEDENVAIAFGALRDPDYSFMGGTYADFIITNKTNVELTFQPSAISFDGLSYQFMGSEDVAPNSTGTVTFTTDSVIPHSAETSTGTVTVVDFSKSFTDDMSYEAKW